MQLGATRGLLSKNRLGEVLAETEIQRSAKSRGTLSREFHFREIGNFCPPFCSGNFEHEIARTGRDFLEE